MKELVAGHEAALSALADQLRYIYENYPDVAIVGRLGRLAIYDQYMHLGKPDIEEIEPARATADEQGSRSDIDVLFTPDELFYDRRATEPHQIDYFLEGFIDLDEEGAVEISGNSGPESFSISSEKQLFGLFTRYLRINGTRVPVRTFSIAVQQQIGHLMASPDESEKYTRHRSQFDDFAAYVRALLPDEFPSDEDLQPLLDANRLLIRRAIEPQDDGRGDSTSNWRLSSG